ncbi:hypothetical protein TNCV_3123881 [Trichonephila clavipes]|nr:hypothetical protein TNCV_3123881 [Trichonephila clavipes]
MIAWTQNFGDKCNSRRVSQNESDSLVIHSLRNPFRNTFSLIDDFNFPSREIKNEKQQKNKKSLPIISSFKGRAASVEAKRRLGIMKKMGFKSVWVVPARKNADRAHTLCDLVTLSPGKITGKDFTTGVKNGRILQGKLTDGTVVEIEAGASFYTDPSSDVRQMHMNVVKCSN